MLLQLVHFLDDFVIGQESAKKVLSVACVIRELCATLDKLSERARVYNHYNRVRANLAATRQDELEWGEEALALEEGSFHENSRLIYPYCSRLVQQEVAPARLMPHPQRLQVGYPLQPRQAFPLFEKSNVLVMWVLLTPIFPANTYKAYRCAYIVALQDQVSSLASC